MTDYVTLEATKLALRIDHDDDDAHLGLLISGASRMVAQYLKGNAPEIEYPEEADPEIKIATIMLVGHLYNNPDSDPDKAFDPGYLPAPVQSILYPLRTPTLS